MKVNVGDVVVLKSDTSIKMTVSKLLSGDLCEVVWFVNCNFHAATVGVDALQKAQ